LLCCLRDHHQYHSSSSVSNTQKGLKEIKLVLGHNGWGTGVHPTTKVCLEFLSDPDIIKGKSLLDFGCGSGILSLAALHMGATRTLGVDIEAEALMTSQANMKMNGFTKDDFQPLHTRQILPGGLKPPFDVCIANILIGQLVRPSMVIAIVTNVAPGGLICFSGIRMEQVPSLKQAYAPFVEKWVDERELAAKECEGAFESFGADVGIWAMVVGKLKEGQNKEQEMIDAFSEQAVS